MPEEHDGLNNDRIDEGTFLEQCNLVFAERRQMMLFELERFKEGFFYCLYDTPDRLQHMFWRYREPEHPANRKNITTEYSQAIEEHYAACDAIIGEALEYVDDQTLFIVLSDHGMGSFQRGLNLNTWLFENGFLTLRKGATPGPDQGEFFHNVDWSRTRAYALGLGGIYLNLAGRERDGIVKEEDASIIKNAL